MSRQRALEGTAIIILRERYGDNLKSLRRADALMLVKKAVADAASLLPTSGAYNHEQSEAVQALMRRLLPYQ